MMRSQWLVAACLLWMTPCVALGAAFAVDDFQSGTTAGWTGGASPTLQATGGPDDVGDAFLQLTSDGAVGPGSRLATYNQQANWIGDVGALGATSLSVDMMSPLTSRPLEMRLVLFGPVNPVSPTNLNRRWTSSVAAQVPNDGVWRTYTFSLAEADLTRVQGTDTYDDMIADVLRVMLRHDAGSPSATGSSIAATFGMDNVGFVPPPNPADGNGDGWVDGLDYLLWAGNFGTHPGSDGDTSDGDYNDDGWVDGLDYLLWAANFGSHAATSVPEPGASALLVLGAFIALLRRRMRR